MGSEKRYPEGLLGRKVGMSQIFNDAGEAIPVTIIETGPCFILDVKKQNTHGYSAVQLGFGPKKAQRVNKAATGHFARGGKGSFYHVKEMRCDAEQLGWTTLGQELKVGDVFQGGQFVDVVGVTRGRGFSGVVRRHHMKGQPMTRGTHEYRRHIGAVGCRKFPHHIFKGKRMPGHMGDVQVTIQNLEVVAVRPEENLILVRGGIPGAKGSLVVIKKAMKKSAKAAA